MGTFPLGALGGHLWGRIAARAAPPAGGQPSAVAPAVADGPTPVVAAPPQAPTTGPADENYTLSLAERIIELGCPPAALAAAAVARVPRGIALRGPGAQFLH